VSSAEPTIDASPFLDGSYEELVERFFDEGWSDGLPVVIPTPRLVDAMLAGIDADRETVIGAIPPGGGVATLERVAVNAVMAGCRPEHLPLVVASLRAMLHPDHNLNGVSCTTHPCVSLVIVHGPQRKELGFITTDGVFGSGSRANGAVGRAVRLLCWNLGGARPGGEDKSCLSQPGEWSFCIAEDEEGSRWPPFHAERGLRAEQNAVTVFACEPPHSIIAIGSPEAMVERIISQMVARGSNNAEYRFGRGGQLLVTVNAEQVERFDDAGWSKADLRQYLWENSQCRVADLLESGDAYSSEVGTRNGFLARGEMWADWSDPDALLPITPSPDDIHVVVCGGRSFFASVSPGWGPFGGWAVTLPVSPL
jgi:hypothetical protein